MSTVNSSKITASTTRITPPWRRGRVAVNEATDADLAAKQVIEDDASTTPGSSDVEDVSPRARADSETTSETSTRYIPPWRRCRSSANETVADDKKTTNDDDASVTTACSDDEDASSVAHSDFEVSHVISRNALLIHRERYLSTAASEDSPPGLHCRKVASEDSSPGLRCRKVGKAPLTAKASPPGLTAQSPVPAPPGFVAPPGLAMLKGAALAKPEYTPSTFRKELMDILKDLAMDRNVARAVRRVRLQNVPKERQAAEYADAMTFILEEHRGAARRSFVALLAGLAYGVFERKECIVGLDIFFLEIYHELQEEVPKLSKMVLTELLPTLASVFAADELGKYESLAKLSQHS